MAGEDDLDVLAGEYVLGTLAPDERAADDRRLLDNQELALRVAQWEARLAPLSAARSAEEGAAPCFSLGSCPETCPFR